MAENLPLALDMATCRKVAERADVAFRAELRNLIYAFPDHTVEQLERELALATYRAAMRRLGEAPGCPQGEPGPDRAVDAPETENAVAVPPRAVVTGLSEGSGRWEATEEFDCLVEATPLPTNGAKS